MLKLLPIGNVVQLKKEKVKISILSMIIKIKLLLD